MPRFVLRDAGYPTYKKIMSGGKWIGRVCKCANGTYFGIIGKTEVKALTERSAFDEVIALHCGFKTSDDMDRHNSKVRAVNRSRKANARHIANEFLRGNSAPLDQLLDHTFGRAK